MTRPATNPAHPRQGAAPYPDEPPFDPDYDHPAAATTPGPRDAADVSYDHAAEQAVIGSMLLNPALVDEITAEATPADHYRPQHEDIHTAILALHHDGTPIDMVTVGAELHRRGLLLKVGGAPYLHTCTEAVSTPANGITYARIVRDHARLRVAATVGSKLLQLGRTGDVTKVDTYLGEAVQTLDDAAMRFGPRQGAGTGLHDLAWILTGTPPVVPPPTLCHRTDGTALFYAGKVNGIFGDPEGGKTWLAQTAMVEALNSGGTAAMIDVDHNGPDHTAARLLLLGARLTDIADPTRFRYYEPEDGEQLTAAVNDITSWAPTVLLVDSLGEIFPMLGVNTNDGDEITTAMRQVCTRPAVAGSCVITIDHLPKSSEARSTGYAIGSIAKKRMIRGSYLRAEARVQPTPGGIGRVTLRIEKDTAGELRKSSGGGYAGTLVLDSTADHITKWEISREEAPKNDDGTFRPTTYMERVASYVADNEGCTQNEIESAIPGTAKHIRTALHILVSEGHITRTRGKNRAWLHVLTIPYREAEDDHAQQTL